MHASTQGAIFVLVGPHDPLAQGPEHTEIDNLGQ